jgi:hypothetical protein
VAWGTYPLFWRPQMNKEKLSVFLDCPVMLWHQVWGVMVKFWPTSSRLGLLQHLLWVANSGKPLCLTTYSKGHRSKLRCISGEEKAQGKVCWGGAALPCPLWLHCQRKICACMSGTINPCPLWWPHYIGTVDELI